MELKEAVYLTDEDLEVFGTINDMVNRSVATGSAYGAFAFARSLKRNIHIQGIALAKLLWEINSRWKLYQEGGTDDEFVNVAEAELKLKPDTIMKYVRMWDAVFVNGGFEDDVQRMLLGKPIKWLLLLPAAVSDGDIDINEVVNADSYGEVRDIVSKARGVQTSAHNRLIIMMDARDGTISAKVGQNEYSIVIGFLNLSLQSQSDTAKRAIEKIIRNADILEV